MAPLPEGIQSVRQQQVARQGCSSTDLQEVQSLAASLLVVHNMLTDYSRDWCGIAVACSGDPSATWAALDLIHALYDVCRIGSSIKLLFQRKFCPLYSSLWNDEHLRRQTGGLTGGLTGQ